MTTTLTAKQIAEAQFNHRHKLMPYRMDPETKELAIRSLTAEVERMVAMFEQATVTDGVPRWKSNGRVPHGDMIDTWRLAGKPVDLLKSRAARHEEAEAFLAEYRKQQAGRNPELIAEQRAEARAAFGPGVELVNILTGEKYRT